MWSRIPKSRLLIALLASLAMLGVMACGGAEETPAAPAAAPAPAPAPVAPAPAQAAPAPAAPAQAAAPAPAPAPVAPPRAPTAPQTVVGAPKPALSRTDPSLLAGTLPGGMVDYQWTGPVPTTFNESPMLAELVRAGRLPAVDERLPDPPAVQPPNEAIGKYGGTWRRAYIWNGDHAGVGGGFLQQHNGDGILLNDMAETWEIADGGRSVTIGLRKGHKWSDGQPFTSADFEWTWNNITLNKEFTPVFSASWSSPATKSPPTMEILDDQHIQFKWDDPNWAHIENQMKGCPWCRNAGFMMGPSHYNKQFHKDFADPTELKRLMDEEQVDNWVDLLKIKTHIYRIAEKPCLAAWCTSDGAEGAEWILSRNPYFHSVDPAGNQLPYIDTVHLTLVEDLEVVSLKASAGEIDFQARHITLAAVPLYQKNAEKANIYVMMTGCTCPTDAVININQSYDKDPVIGKLLRTRDFRRALSMGFDREEMNEIFFLGKGTERAYVPAPGTLYYPGDDYLHRWATKDYDAANKLLDGIGLTKKDADGFRMRPDGKGPLTLHFMLLEGYSVDYAPAAEIVGSGWKNLGIKTTYKESRSAHKDIQANEQYLFMWEANGAWNPWKAVVWIAPQSVGFRSAVEIGRYNATLGKQGEPATIDKYKNEDGKYPFQRLWDIIGEGAAFQMDSPERIALGKEIFEIISDEVIHIGTVAGVGATKGIRVINRDFKNVPVNAPGPEIFSQTGARPELYFFDR